MYINMKNCRILQLNIMTFIARIVLSKKKIMLCYVMLCYDCYVYWWVNIVWNQKSHSVGLPWYFTWPSASRNPMPVPPQVILSNGRHNLRFLPFYQISVRSKQQSIMGLPWDFQCKGVLKADTPPSLPDQFARNYFLWVNIIIFPEFDYSNNMDKIANCGKIAPGPWKLRWLDVNLYVGDINK